MLQLQPKVTEFKKQGLELIIVTFGDKKANQEFFKKHSINADFVYDENYSVVSNYRVSSIPANFYISREGTLEGDSIGWTAKSMSIIDKFIETGKPH